MYDLVQPVFHADSVHSNKLFVNEGILLNAKDERIWLGAGMYFWDTKSNAEYWKKIKKRHNNSGKYSIIKASLRCNNKDLLNLTDEDSVNELQEYVEECAKIYCQQRDEEIDLSKMKPGEIINFAYKCSKLYNPDKTFKCVKGIGLYKKHGDNFVVNEDRHGLPIHLTSRGKIIYSVREKETLFDRQEM